MKLPSVLAILMAVFAGYGLGLADSFQQQGRAGGVQRLSLKPPTATSGVRCDTAIDAAASLVLQHLWYFCISSTPARLALLHL